MAFDFAAAAAAVPWSYLLYGLLGSALLWQARLLLDRLWWRPRRLERTLRAQGVGGTPYRFLMGDLKEFGRLNDEAWSKPLPLRCHDIVPRVTPFLHNNVRDNGKPCFSWFGPVANVAITDLSLSRTCCPTSLATSRSPSSRLSPSCSPTPYDPRGGEMGQAQEDPQSRVPS
ncbi:cytochrome P450 72A15-like [Hordeum vulgare]|nr:cytochrome P450 72A15-like [Hordeum vulgare]